MGCLTKKCRKNNCKDRCTAFFPNNVQLKEGCQGACDSHFKSINTREDYLCNLGLVDEQTIILAYGYDPCPGGASVATIHQEWNEASPTRQLQEKMITILIVGAVVLFVALIGIIILKNKRK